jgi:hypothetical protein
VCVCVSSLCPACGVPLGGHAPSHAGESRSHGRSPASQRMQCRSRGPGGSRSIALSRSLSSCASYYSCLPVSKLARIMCTATAGRPAARFSLGWYGGRGHVACRGARERKEPVCQHAPWCAPGRGDPSSVLNCTRALGG